MSPEIITAIISAGTTLIVSIGTWQVSNYTARKKDQEVMRAMLDAHKDETRNQIDGLRDEITRFNSQVQERLAVLDVTMQTLSDRVDKHNSIVDRTYVLERDTAIQKEQIENIKAKLA